MRQDSIEIAHANSTGRARRIWHGHGCSRVVIDNPRELPLADVIDEALAGFEPVATSTTQAAAANGAHIRRPINLSLVAGLSAQLEALDRQRDHLAHLLRSIDDPTISK